MKHTNLKSNTVAGLLLALFGAPLIVFIASSLAPDYYTNKFIVIKELSIFGVLGLLLLVIVKGERLGLDSIGLHNKHWGKSILWGGILAIASLTVLLFIAGILQALEIQIGGDEGKKYQSISLWAMSLVVLRAGIVEEICYRGFAMQRFEQVNDKPYFFLGIPLLIFALVHYSQGWAGILISFVLGGIMALFYLKKRDLKALIIAHFLVDLVPNVLIPLFSSNQ